MHVTLVLLNILVPSYAFIFFMDILLVAHKLLNILVPRILARYGSYHILELLLQDGQVTRTRTNNHNHTQWIT